MIQQFNYLTQDIHLNGIMFKTLELSQAMEEYVTGYTVVTPKLNELVPYHKHLGIEHTLVVKGSVRFNVEEELIDIYSGQLIIINAEMLHSMVALELGTMLFIGF